MLNASRCRHVVLDMQSCRRSADVLHRPRDGPQESMELEVTRWGTKVSLGGGLGHKPPKSGSFPR